jgi:colicin import membrane protein
MKKNALQLEDLKVSNLPELQGWKEKQQKLVDDNPYVEIVDNKTYDVACKSRTALLKGRTELEKQDKLIASKLTSFRKEVKQETDNLIAITLPYEEKQQSEVKRFEEIKAAEKAEEKRIEQLRVDTIKSKINNFETASYGVIQDTTIENVDLHKSMLDAFANADFDYEEFDILFEQAKARIQSSWDLKCADIQEKEAQRVENERLQKEAEQARRISELQASRLNELTPYIAYGEPMDLANLHSIDESVWIEVIASKKALFEAEQKKQQEAQEKIEADKQKIFEIRVKRFQEAGVELGEGFVARIINRGDGTQFELTKEMVLDSDTIEFETLFSNTLLEVEKHRLNVENAEEQRIADEKLAKEDAERLKKENKAREKRLAKDKKVLKEFIENIYLSNKTSVFLSEDETIVFFDGIVLKKLHLLISELLTDLNNL